MIRWSMRQLVALILAAVVAVGMSFSAVQASAMTAQMAVASDTGVSSHGGCQSCPDKGSDNGIKATPCGTVCIAPMVAMLPAIAGLVLSPEASPLIAARDPLLSGVTSRPTLDPPRSTDIA